LGPGTYRLILGIRSLAIAAFLLLIASPIALAVLRLIGVAGANPGAWIETLDGNYMSAGAIEFTFLQSILSSLATISLGLPVAWLLGRYDWRMQSMIRAVLTVPFVMPSIIAAMGILTLTGDSALGIRSDEGTWFWTLIIAHAWFNMSLVIRFCEPILATLDPSMEEQLRLLPAGRTISGRVRHLWLPVLIPPLSASFCMSFVFSFTSFALVRWITIRDNTLESVMAISSPSAGIEGYMAFTSEIVLASSLIQFAVLSVSLWLASRIQRELQRQYPMAPARVARGRFDYGWVFMAPALLFSIAPILSVAIGSVRVRTVESGRVADTWSLDGWEVARDGSFSMVPLSDAMANSILYATISLVVSMPLGYCIASAIHSLERTNRRLSEALDFATMAPFAFSAAMIGLGVTLGVTKLDPAAFSQFWPLPALAHVMLTTPFAIRIMLTGLRSIDREYDETARVLGMGPLARLTRVRIPLMKGPITVAAIFCLAMSLGEFGASFIVATNSDWATLPLLADSWRGMPMNPLAEAASNAVATALAVMAILLFAAAERARSNERGGMF